MYLQLPLGISFHKFLLLELESESVLLACIFGQILLLYFPVK